MGFGSLSFSSGAASSRSKFCRRSPKTLGVRAGSGAEDAPPRAPCRKLGARRLACGAAVGAGSKRAAGRGAGGCSAAGGMNGAVVAATVPAEGGMGDDGSPPGSEAISKLSPSSVSNSAASEFRVTRRPAAAPAYEDRQLKIPSKWRDRCRPRSLQWERRCAGRTLRSGGRRLGRPRRSWPQRAGSSG